jgi:hypothetical protein
MTIVQTVAPIRGVSRTAICPDCLHDSPYRDGDAVVACQNIECGMPFVRAELVANCPACQAKVAYREGDVMATCPNSKECGSTLSLSQLAGPVVSG